MKRIVLAVMLLLLGVSNAGAVTCTISGLLLDPANNPVPNATLQFNSLIDQTVAGVVIPATLATTTTDNNGNIAAFALQQGISGQFVICQPKAGGCGTPTPTLIPLAGTANFADIVSGTAISAGNGTVGNLVVTGHATIAQTSCGALALAQATLNSVPPNQDFLLISGAHCVGSTSATFVADTTSALMFGNFFNPVGPINNAGWQWLGDQGLTVGANFIPTLRMTLDNNGELGLPDSTTAAIQLHGGSVKSSGVTDIGIAAGAHWSGGNWIADQSAAGFISLAGASMSFFGNSGLTVGSPIATGGAGFNLSPSAMSMVFPGTSPSLVLTPNALSVAVNNSTTLSGSNPALVVQSTTNAGADILQIYPQNQTQGIGMWWNEIHSIGSSTNVNMDISTKGGGSVLFLQNANPGANIQPVGPVVLNGNWHFYAQANGVNPALASCPNGVISAGSSDTAGAVSYTAGSISSCLINFARGYGTPPVCICNVVESFSPSVVVGRCYATVNTTQVQLNYDSGIQNNTGGATWHCIGDG